MIEDPNSIPIPQILITDSPNPTQAFIQKAMEDIIGGTTEDNAPSEFPPGITAANVLPEIPFTVVADSDSAACGKTLKVNDGSIAIYVPDGWSVKELDLKAVHQLMKTGLAEWDTGNTVNYEFNPDEQRTCRFYTAGRAQLEEFNAVVSDEYEFDRPHSYGVCSCDKVKTHYAVNNPACPNEQKQAGCKFYEMGTVKTESIHAIKHTTNPETPVNIKLTSKRSGPGYKVGWATINYPDESSAHKVSREDFAGDMSVFMQKILDLAITMHGPVDSIEEVSIEPEQDKNEYLKYVLSA